jgi:LPXTG-site transpeptidase (sortase) family protein
LYVFLVLVLSIVACGRRAAEEPTVAPPAPAQASAPREEAASDPPRSVAPREFARQTNDAPAAEPTVASRAARSSTALWPRNAQNPAPVKAEPTGRPSMGRVSGPKRVAQTAPTATPTVEPTPAPKPAEPARLVIEKIGVDAAVEHVAKDETGAMDVPQAWQNVAWYELGPRPGEGGNSVIAGHLDTKTHAAVFWRLKELEPGDLVTVVDANGVGTKFRVTAKESYEEDQAPLYEIFGHTQKTRLNLITCDGDWNKTEDQYSNRLVVYTEKVEA